MSAKSSQNKYSEEFRKTIVTLYQSGKTCSEIQKEYGVSSPALSKWIRKYSQVQVEDGTVLTAQQVKAPQRRNAELEKVIACRASPRIDRFPAIDTLRDAVRTRGISSGVMFHSDRGSQFTSSGFRMVQSFSAKGHPYDHAVSVPRLKTRSRINAKGPQSVKGAIPVKLPAPRKRALGPHTPSLPRSPNSAPPARPQFTPPLRAARLPVKKASYMSTFPVPALDAHVRRYILAEMLSPERNAHRPWHRLRSTATPTSASLRRCRSKATPWTRSGSASPGKPNSAT